MDMDKMKDSLRQRGYKLTNQRKAILEVLASYKGHVLSAEQIYEKTKEKYPKTNFSTIYRNLEILEKTEFIHRINMNGRASKYKVICNHGHHHHVICKDCGKSEIIDFCPLENIDKKLVNKDFILTDHNFELYGYCKKCIERNKKEQGNI
ncbi:MAG: transcriptional repressor [Epulopiscium sp.]|nr:transcriptional repressor [Candidatus Epulonipiscium sp.]